MNQGDGDFDSFRGLVLLGHYQTRNCTKEHKRKKTDADDGGRDTSRPYLLQRKAYGGQALLYSYNSHPFTTIAGQMGILRRLPLTELRAKLLLNVAEK